MKKRILSLALVLALCLGLASTALAYDMGKVGEYNIISADDNHTAAIDENGSLWMWGANHVGQLGIGGNEASHVPVKVMDNVVSVSCGWCHTAAIQSDGSLWMWGLNDDGQLGNGGKENSAVPVKVMDHVVSVSCGGSHTAAIRTDGSLWMWGNNEFGQLGSDSGNDTAIDTEWKRSYPIQTVPVKVMDNVTVVSCGGAHTAAIKTDGSLWAWGFNLSGQLGFQGGNSSIYTYDREPFQTVPVKVLDNVTTVSCGGSHTAAIKTDGSMWIWGDDSYGQTGGYREPGKILDNVISVSCGGTFTAAIQSDGTLWTWGSNTYGALGQGVVGEWRGSRGKVMDHVAAVSCGYNCAVAVKTDGTLWVWGDNSYDELSRDGKSTRWIPLQVWGVTLPKGVRLFLNGGMGGGKLWTDSTGSISVPTNPTRPGYTFGGWYTDAALTIPWNFNDKVVNTLVLYAKWVPVSSTASTTGKSQSTITLNGGKVTLDAYVLKAANGGDVTYVKLRDVAALLDGTKAKFNVDWRSGAIYVDSGKAYTTKNGTELKAISGTDGSYKWNTAPVLFDGTTKALEGIVLTDGKGGGHTFFKLRDLGQAIGFTVGWSAQQGIYIETD